MRTFIISDTHFCHENILKFEHSPGIPLRPGFRNIKEHDEILIENWNRIVRTKDKVYHLGDVGFFKGNQARAILSCLNGTKVLIKGNHDILKASVYLEYFKDIRACHSLDKIILAHIPLHPSSLERWRGQIHGHTHMNDVGDPRYYNVSVEKQGFCPVDFEEIRTYFKGLENETV